MIKFILIVLGIIGVIWLTSVLFGGLGEMKYRIYTGDTTYYTNDYKEKDGCIEFTSYTELQVRLCGYYSVIEQR